MDLYEVNKLVKFTKDWPKPGVDFCDIFSILVNPTAYRTVLDTMCRYITDHFAGKVDAIVGLGARGFVIGPPMAEILGMPFYPVRKDGELPGACITDEYAKEYGTSTQAMQVDAFPPGTRVVLVDDLLATGGSLASAARLVRRLGGSVVLNAVVFNVKKFEKGRNLSAPVFSVLQC
jgi:adenine phosphoribosyltransferase